jgi:hypothetical protein
VDNDHKEAVGKMGFVVVCVGGWLPPHPLPPSDGRTLSCTLYDSITLRWWQRKARAGR